MRKTIPWLLCAALMLLLPTPGAYSLDGEEAPGTLTVITDFDSAPFSFRKRLDPEGFEIDLLGVLAQQLGAKLVWKEMTFDPEIFARCLNTKVADAAVASTTITPEREELMAFTRPYFVSGQAVAVGEKAEWKDGDVGAAMKGKRLGAMERTTGEAYAREHFKDAEIQTYHTADSLSRALRAGWVEAIILDEELLAYLASQNSYRFRIVARDLTHEEYAIAVAKGNGEMLNRLNAGLQKADETGKYGEIYEKWFGHKASLPPAPAGSGN
jgi:ABC-type amino acid transport substrate-binding protein